MSNIIVNVSATAMAQYAAANGPDSADRPFYAKSNNGMAFVVGLWARERGITVYTVRKSRGYLYILNDTYKIKFYAKSNNGMAFVVTH